MPIQVIIEKGTDYMDLLDVLEDEGYENTGYGGHTVFEMADGTRAVWEIKANATKADREFHEIVESETDGKIEFRTEVS